MNWNDLGDRAYHAGLRLTVAVAVVFSFLARSAYAAAGDTTYEVLVLNSAVTAMVTGNIDAAQRKGVIIQNNGPNAIWCAVGKSALAVVDKSLKVAASGGTLYIGTKLPVHCRASTADQVTGAASTVVEVL